MADDMEERIRRIRGIRDGIIERLEQVRRSLRVFHTMFSTFLVNLIIYH